MLQEVSFLSSLARNMWGITKWRIELIISILNFLYSTNLFKDFKFKMSLIPLSVCDLTKIVHISSPGSCFMWAMILFPIFFYFSCLTNSVSTSLKGCWNEFALGNDEVILIYIPFIVWKTFGSGGSVDHSL